MCRCQVGERYPPSTSSPVFPAYLSHLAISPGEPLIVPPRAVRKVWRRRRKPDIKMQKNSQMKMKGEWIEFARSHKNGCLLNAWRISKAASLRCESGKLIRLRTYWNTEQIVSAVFPSFHTRMEPFCILHKKKNCLSLFYSLCFCLPQFC